MKHKKLFALSAAAFMVMGIFLTACKKSSKAPEEVIDYLKNLSSYRCSTEILIKNDRQELKYDLKQYCDSSQGYRIEIGSDRVQIYKGDKIYVKDIKNGSNFQLEKDFDSLYSISLIGEYIKMLYTNKSISYSINEIGGQKYQLVELILPGNNRNLYRAVMYIALKNYVPENIVVYDNKDKERVNIKYSDFIPEEKLDKQLFSVE